MVLILNSSMICVLLLADGTRTAMDNFADCFEKEPFKKYYKQIRTITRTMGTVRDLDVLIAAFSERELKTLSGAWSKMIFKGLIEHLQHET